jgi:hypothetical protein
MRIEATLITLLTVAQLECASGPVPCTSPGTCPTGTECLANRCLPVGSDPVPEDSRRLVLRPTSLALVSSRGHTNAGALPPAFAFGSRREGAVALYLRFEPRWQGQSAVHSAFLLLDPLPGTQVGTEAVAVRAWRVERPWQPAELSWLRQPPVVPPSTDAWARSSPPATLRVDVTPIVRYWQDHPRANRGLALLASGDGAHGASYATGTNGGIGPRLELYFSE